jgi:hypothetical protein
MIHLIVANSSLFEIIKNQDKEYPVSEQNTEYS